MAHPAAYARAADALRPSTGLSSTDTAAGIKRKRPSDRKFYAVKAGKRPGIYESWPDCLSQVTGHKGAVFKAFHSQHEAQAFLDGTLPSPPASSGDAKFYAVQNGRVPGVYREWTQAQAQISGFRKPKHRKFNTRAEAEAFVAAGRKNGDLDGSSPTLGAEEHMRRSIVRDSAPGLQMNGPYAPTDKDGNLYEIGRRPLPPGAEDGFDPNVRLADDGSIVERSEQEKRKTKTVTKGQDPPGMLRIYTDGSSLKNGMAGAKAGVGVFFGPQDPKNVSEALKGSKQTNQRAELTAILRALEIAPRHREVTIYTDSKYAIDCVTNWYRNWQKNGWQNAKGKPVENKDLVVDIRSKIEERELLHKQTFFVWVKGHKDNVGNIAADRLAVQGAMSAQAAVPGPRGHRANNDEALDDETAEAFDAMERAMEEDSDDEFR